MNWGQKHLKQVGIMETLLIFPLQELILLWQIMIRDI